MVKLSVRVEDDTGAVTEYTDDLPIKRIAYFDGEIRNLPEWMIDKIVPTAQKALEIGEVWTGWNKKKSLTIRGKNGYLIADKGSIIIDRGDNIYVVIKLKPVDWAT